VKLLGTFQAIDVKYGVFKPTGGNILIIGLAYYISPIRSLSQAIDDPTHFLTYVIWMMVTCGFFANLYVSISGRSPEDVAKELRKNDKFLIGYQDRSMVI
jgi:protein transport protein SEC61 subunit alpha